MEYWTVGVVVESLSRKIDFSLVDLCLLSVSTGHRNSKKIPALKVYHHNVVIA
jgi:hypothetical protein